MSSSIDYSRRVVGERFPVRHPSQPQEYLDAAVRAERFVDSYRVDTADGIHWNDPEGDRDDVTWFGGTAGIMRWYLSLQRQTGSERYARIARDAARYLAKHWNDVLASPPASFSPALSLGYYHGAAGVGQMLIEMQREFPDAGTFNAINEIADWYLAHQRRDSQGVSWTGVPAPILDGGVTLFLIDVARLTGRNDFDEAIGQSGERMLSFAERMPDGGLRFNGYAPIGDEYQPNFEFGTTGIAFQLTRLFDYCGEQRYLDAALAAAKHVRSLFVRQAEGYAIPCRYGADGLPVTDEQGRVLYYPGLCIGTSGSLKLFCRLFQITGDSSYNDRIVELTDGFNALGGPETQSAGLWNNICWCCGHAGIVHIYAGLAAVHGDERFKAMALRAADVLLGWEERLQTPQEASDWPTAYERIHPEHVTRPIGLWNGAAGVGQALLEAHQLAVGRPDFLAVADEPFA